MKNQPRATYTYSSNVTIQRFWENKHIQFIIWPRYHNLLNLLHVIGRSKNQIYEEDNYILCLRDALTPVRFSKFVNAMINRKKSTDQQVSCLIFPLPSHESSQHKTILRYITMRNVYSTSIFISGQVYSWTWRIGMTLRCKYNCNQLTQAYSVYIQPTLTCNT